MTKLKDLTLEQIATFDCEQFNDCKGCPLYEQKSEVLGYKCVSTLLNVLYNEYGDIELPIKTQQND